VQVPENIHTHPVDGNWKFQGGHGGLKTKIFGGTYAAKLEFLEGLIFWNFWRILGSFSNQKQHPWGLENG